jgi:signal transduction histidine kinase
LADVSIAALKDSDADGGIDERRQLFATALATRAVLAIAFVLVALAMGVLALGPWANCMAVAGILFGMAAANAVYWPIGKRRNFPKGDLAVHDAVDVVVLTIVIHFAGGVNVPYGSVAFLSLVLFSAVAQSRAVAVRLAAFSISSLLVLLVLEESQIVYSYADMWGYRMPLHVQIYALVVSGLFLLNVAWVAGSLSDQLRAANVNLRKFSARIEEQNRTLERKVADRTEALARATQEIEDLVHIVSHDLKNVAVAVTETARKLVTRENVNLSDRGKSYAEHLLEDGRTMSRMLEDLLLLFRHTEGAGTRAEWVDVDSVVRQSLRQLQYQVEAKRIEVSVGPLPSVFAETQKMRHIFDNLLNNACKYVGDKKPARVEISGSANGSVVRYVVRDNGVGLDERQRARIFQLYHRSPAQEVEGVVQEGHGVGLAIVKRIVERYGGTIAVESTPREGTTFEVILPRGDEPRA